MESLEGGARASLAQAARAVITLGMRLKNGIV